VKGPIPPLLTALALAGCTSVPVRRAGPSGPRVFEPAPVACPAAVDVPAFLARHASAYGSLEAVARALPRSFAGESVAARGEHAAIELVLDRDGRFSETRSVDGLLSASGVDARGPWALTQAGVALRLRGEEAVDVAFAAWLHGREYLASFDPGRDTAKCAVDVEGAHVSVHFALPEVGSPELDFGLADGALRSVTHLDAGDHATVLSIRAWSDADSAGVRWPLAIDVREASGLESLVTLTASTPGAPCTARDRLGPPTARLAFSWPRDASIRVPARFFMNEVLLQVRVGGRALWGLVDSGATLNVVDAGSPLASALRLPPVVERTTPGSLQRGEVREPIELGALVVEHVPVAAVPIPSFDEFGLYRPEMLIGYPVFLGAAVRIDYSREEFLLSKDARVLRSDDAIPVPLKFLGGTLVAQGRIDGIDAWFVLDTGDSETLDLFHDWAATHGFPGARPTYTFRQQSEVGDAQTDEQRVRPATFELGPIRLSEPLTAIDSSRSPSDRIAGQVGNGVLAHCAAAVFDVEHRTLWLEPPCNRDLSDDLSGWALARSDSVSYPDRPWVVKFVIPGGSADLSGVKPGDRLVQIGGHPATLDISTFEASTRKPPGSEVFVVLVRDGEERELTLRLTRLPAR